MIVSKSEDHEKGNALKKSHKDLKKIKNLNLFSQFLAILPKLFPHQWTPFGKQPWSNTLACIECKRYQLPDNSFTRATT